MILYHGTNVDFETIDLSKCKRGKDFGCGFYLSADEQQALEIAQNRIKFQGGEVIIQKYGFDDSLLGDHLLFQ